MATFISLLNFTDQGIRSVKKSPGRAEEFKAMAEKLGVTVRDIYWTVGRYDLVVVLEGTDEAVTKALLIAGSLGNVRSESLRAFTEGEFNGIVGNMP
ncbi:MAG: GYD domain-containing protein [Acidobacteriota bacterium]|nr:GYD domain-containing protein [Acidobacteriota bacterium]MDH3530842.1 GYD domain-containing protein [Acidobacteriota bacterium]